MEQDGALHHQLFDHTSLIRFLEARFAHHRPDLVEANITPWRRAVVGDLTSAFDFRTPNASRRINLPATDDLKLVDLVFHDDEVPVPPADPHLPTQEQGVRPARALPYELRSHGTVRPDGSLVIDFHNGGDAAAVFHVRSADPSQAPRTYTVSPHQHVDDTWPTGGAVYDISVYGPNGFFRQFKGSAAAGSANLVVREQYDARSKSISLAITNHGAQTVTVRALNRYSSRSTQFVLGPGEDTTHSWSLGRAGGWYDLALTVDGDPSLLCHFAGHLEYGTDSISDPLMGGLV